jgi:hypothetical protein
MRGEPRKEEMEEPRKEETEELQREEVRETVEPRKEETGEVRQEAQLADSISEGGPQGQVPDLEGVRVPV